MKAKLEKIFLLLAVGLFVSVAYYRIAYGEFLLMGYKPFFILSESMEPCIKTYQIVLGVPINDSEIEVGDIAAYELYAEGSQRIKETIIHRVHSINEDGTYQFKGDNNTNIDVNSVEKDRIKYKIVIY